MEGPFDRTRMLLGDEALARLADARVAVFGVGGVGGSACEALARSGVGYFLLVDRDVVSVSNRNRQIIALASTAGRPKTEVMRARILDINPDAVVDVRDCFFLPGNADTFDFAAFDYVVDAVDTVSAKLALIERSRAAGTPVISAMGAGNKLDPTRFRVSDISQTRVCPLARVMRRELKKRGIDHVKVVWSDEEALTPTGGADADPGRRSTPGSVAWVPTVAGLILAGAVVTDLIRGAGGRTPPVKDEK